jgi:DNA transformation protein
VTRPATLADLANLGPKSQAMLAAAGIDSVDRLRELGAVEAFCRVQASGARPSLNLLWALEGALTGLHWRDVARDHRTSLLLALEQRTRGDA